MMIQMKLRSARVKSLPFFNRDNKTLQFSRQENQLVTDLTELEFKKFLRDNNLIVYHNMLKGYQDGEIYGEFTIRERTKNK